MSTPEEQFEQWARRESYTAQRQRLQRRLDRLEWAEILAYFLMLLWVVGTFVAFQLGWTGAYLAAVITVWTFVAGAVVVWAVRRQQTGVKAQIEALDDEYAHVAIDEPVE